MKNKRHKKISLEKLTRAWLSKNMTEKISSGDSLPPSAEAPCTSNVNKVCINGKKVDRKKQTTQNLIYYRYDH